MFLEESAEKWYTTTRLSSNSTAWDFWRSSFIENFGQHGLSVARTAFTYRFISGSSPSDYVQNKLNLLVSFNPHMHESDKMAHLALGLPPHLQDRINYSENTTLGKLIAAINALDRPSIRSVSSSTSSTNAFSSLRPKTPCPYCKKKGFERYHYEKDCFNKFRENQRKNFPTKTDNVTKAIHNLDIEELQDEVNTAQKNE